VSPVPGPRSGSGPRLVVVGDALLDRDVVGTVDRVAPDAPVPVLAATESVDRPGGAALAAALATDLGVAVTLIAPVPDDAGGARLRALLDEAGVELCALPVDGPMPEKIRIRAGGHLLMRVDQAGVPAPVPERLPQAAVAALRAATGVLVSDYGRGVTGMADLRRTVTEVAKRRPVVWDPHPRGSDPVPGVLLATPNEAELAHHVPPEPGSGRLAGVAARAGRLCDAWQVQALAVTLGADGALVAQSAATPLVVPATPTRGGDPCGAGDRFAAAVAAALTRGGILSEAVTQAVGAASRYVAAGGAAAWRPGGPTPRPERAAIGLAAALAAAQAARLHGGTVVATGGCFDLLHVGHLSTLRAARQLGDCLIVCLNSDRSVRALKGTTRPVVPQSDRARLVAALDCVDAVVTFDELTPERVLDQLRPDVWVKGGDYFLAGPDGEPALPEAELVRRWGGQTVVVPYLSGRSTTQLIAAARPDPAPIEGGNS
jgi:rfaE bifunctional protein nucleotidyltransferase chain/domain/rfaE bifunctional protein kinase chain/domain